MKYGFTKEEITEIQEARQKNRDKNVDRRLKVLELKAAGHGQIYYVLHRHGWSKKLPRSKHPKSAAPEAIEASKKLTPESMN